MNGATTHRRSLLGRLALLLAAALAIGAGDGIAFAQPPHHQGGSRAPRTVAPRMAGARPPSGARGPAFAPRPHGGPPNRYGAPRGAAGWNPPGGGRYGPTGRWFAAPPGYARPAPIAGGWRRGGFLPPGYQGSVIQDYGRYHLRRPPYGYSWVRVGNQLLLISSGTGMIFDVVPAY